MTLQFCETCKNLLILQDNHLICQACKTKTPTTQTEISFSETITKKETISGIIPEQDSGHNFKCEKCGHDKAKLTDLGCMIGDEDWVYLLECTKCGWGTRVGNWC